ncbi:hypothetical protein HAX54_053061 [Datura stramonium]|uniref:Uncharacterized protein n=1 Tax=Datura stramonium TaxID=4076 RepID=A0ABS8WT51_DATST|nr:hypothetical protein [Datura stramonium]
MTASARDFGGTPCPGRWRGSVEARSCGLVRGALEAHILGPSAKGVGGRPWPAMARTSGARSNAKCGALETRHLGPDGEDVWGHAHAGRCEGDREGMPMPADAGGVRHAYLRPSQRTLEARPCGRVRGDVRLTPMTASARAVQGSMPMPTMARRRGHAHARVQRGVGGMPMRKRWRARGHAHAGRVRGRRGHALPADGGRRGHAHVEPSARTLENTHMQSLVRGRWRHALAARVRRTLGACQCR